MRFRLLDVSLPVRYCLTGNPKAVGEVFLRHAVFFSLNEDVVTKAQVYHLLTLLLYIFWAVLHTNYSLLSRNLKLRFACLKSQFLKTDTPNQTDTPLTPATPLWSGRCALYQILRLVFKVFNVKQMAKTLLYLQEHGIKSRAELTARADAVSEKLSAAKERITALDTRIAEVNELRGQIICYAKTREVFAEYKASRYSRKFYDANETEIEQHREAKRYFNERNLTRLPKVKDLNAEFSALVAEKRAAYADYRAIRDEHRELLVHRHNVETFLSEEKSTTDRRARGER